jgi:L-cysteate sulfo-lyase
LRLPLSAETILASPSATFCGLADISGGRFEAGDKVLFIMTGGSPGSHAYATDFLGADHKDPS